MKEQIILEILHLLPHYTSDQLYEIKEAARIVLCRDDISAKSTALQPVDNSSLRYLHLYLETCEQAGKSKGTIDLYQFHLSHFLSYANKDITQITDDDVYTYLYNYRHHRTVSNSYMNQIRLILNVFFKWLIKKRLITSNPLDAIDPVRCQKRIKKPMSSAEVELIRSSCESEHAHAAPFSCSLPAGGLFLMPTLQDCVMRAFPLLHPRNVFVQPYVYEIPDPVIQYNPDRGQWNPEQEKI